MPPKEIPGKGIDTGTAAIAGQLAQSVGAREVANVISYVAAWKAFPYLRLAGGIALVASELKKLHGMGEQYKKQLYEIDRSFSRSTYTLTTYRKEIVDISRSLRVGVIEGASLEKQLRSSYATANLSGEAIRNVAKVIGQEFVYSIKEAVQSYIQLREQLPISDELLKKQSVTVADLAEVYRTTGAEGMQFFVRFYARQAGIVDVATDKLTGYQKLMDEMGASIDTLQANIGRGAIPGVTEDVQTDLETYNNAIERSVELVTEQKKAMNKPGIDMKAQSLIAGQIYQTELNRTKTEEKRQVILGAITKQEEELERRKKVATAVELTYEYLKQRALVDYQLQVNDQLMGIQDAQLRILEAQYRPMQEVAGVWLQQLSILDDNLAKQQQLLTLLEKQAAEAENDTEANTRNLAVQTQRLKVADAVAKVAEKEAYIRRSFMEKMMQLQLGLPTGTYTMPTALSERSVKGPGYTPFASLERGPRGEFGETVGGKFRERQQTGPYEKFYQRTFGGGAGFRNPMEQVMQNQLSTQDEMNTKLGQIVDNTAKTGKDFIGPPKPMEEKKWFEAPTGLTDVMGRTEPNLQSITVARPIEYGGSEKEITVTIAAATLEELGNLYETAIDEAVEKFASELDRRSINVSSN